MEEFRLFLHLSNFFQIWSVVSPPRAIGDLWENATSMVNAYNLVIWPPKATKIKTYRQAQILRIS